MRLYRACGAGDESGVALVEFALVVPILLVLLLGMLDFGKAFNFKNDETHLANQAARYAAVNSCTACAGTKLNTWIASQAGASQLQTGLAAAGAVKIAFADSTGKFPDETGYNGASLGTKNHCKTSAVKVLLNFTYPFMPYLKLGSIHIKGSSTMRLESNWGGDSVTGVGLAGTDIYDVLPGTASADTC